MALPEFLLGKPYLDYDSEATLVTAYAMALLQELNGRNVQNPIALLRGEAKYDATHSQHADIHVVLDALNIVTDELRNYGYRSEVWLEAKFFRRNSEGGGMNWNKTTAPLYLIKDLLRLSCLPKERVGKRPNSSRYLLHAYQGNYRNVLAKRRNADPPLNPDKYERKWVDSILKPGRQRLRTFRLPREASQLDGIAGRSSVRSLDMDIQITNWVQRPMVESNQSYTLILTRLDKITCKMRSGSSDIQFIIDDSGISESPGGSFNKIRRHAQQSLRA